MQIRLVSSKRGYHDFDVTDAGSIHRVCVSNNIKHGDIFNIYYGESSKEGGVWLGRKGIAGYLIGDLEKSLRKAPVFIGETLDSHKFYRRVSEQFNECKCSTSKLKPGAMGKVIAVDLDYADYTRPEGRWIVFINKCDTCKKQLTHGSTYSAHSTTGLKELKAQAQKSTKDVIDWNSVITSIEKLERK